MATVGIDTAAMWTTYAADGPGYLEAREPVDDAAFVVVESLVVAFLSISPGAGVWSRAEVRAMVEGRRTERRRLAPAFTGEKRAAVA